MKTYRIVFILSVMTVSVLCAIAPAHADFIRIENIGSVPITGIAFRFEFPPYDGSAGTIFLMSSPPGTSEYTSDYFPPNMPTVDTPLQVGQTLDTYLIPELTGLEYSLHQVDTNYLPLAGTQYGFGMSGHFPIIPDVTVIELNMLSQGFPLASRFTFLSGGIPSPDSEFPPGPPPWPPGPPPWPPGDPPWVSPEPSTLVLLSIGIVGLIGYGLKRKYSL